MVIAIRVAIAQYSVNATPATLCRNVGCCLCVCVVQCTSGNVLLSI